MHKVAVIGAGVIGLSCAIEIQKRFGGKVSVTIFTSDLSPNTTGDVSAGLWTPYLLQNTPEADIIKWADLTQKYFLKLWKGGKAAEAGISLQAMISLNEKIPSWSKIAYGYHQFDRNHLNKLEKRFNKTVDVGFGYTAFTCEPSIFLPYLQNRFVNDGGDLVMKKINNFDELHGFDLIINCAGLNAKSLTGDTKLKPLRGQVARVYAPWQYHVIFEGENYIIPNMNCVILGGTHQDNESDLDVREEDKTVVVGGCQKIVPGLQNAEVIKHQVGLRPGRTEVRIEAERRIIKGKPVHIIHNYGHGGSGVTLCYGCAQTAIDYMQTALNINSSKM